MQTEPVHLPAFIAEIRGGSRSDARRTIALGGVKLDGEVVTDMDVPADSLDGKTLTIGKRWSKKIGGDSI